MKSTLTRLPLATREDQLRRHGLDLSPCWPEVARDNRLAADETEFLREGGWTIVDANHDGRESGMVAHRGVLHPDEHVNHGRLMRLVENELGYTFDDVHAVYRQGRLSNGQRELRGHIDAQLLALSRAGARMVMLGRVLGFALKADGHCRVMENALTRARAAEGTA